jgi:hypothetical protein
MIIPVNCPLCGDVLMNEYKGHPNRSNFPEKLHKTCGRRPDHKFLCVVDRFEEITMIRVDTDLGHFYWNYEKKHMFITPPDSKIPLKLNEITLPWFEPNMQNKKAFFNKLKTYIIFS